MQLQATFGAFLVAATMVHGAPLLVERHVGRTGNGTANANPSGPVSNFRAGGDGFRPGMMQGMNNNGPSAGGSARNDGSDNNGGADQVGGSDGDEGSTEGGDSTVIGGATEDGGSSGSEDSTEDGGSQDNGGSPDNGGSDETGDSTESGDSSVEGASTDKSGSDKSGGSSTGEAAKRSEGKKGKKVQEGGAPGGMSVGQGIAGAASIANSGRSLAERQDSTSQGPGNGTPQGSTTSFSGKPPGVQPNGDTTGPSRNSAPGNGDSRGPRTGSQQAPGGSESSKRELSPDKKVPKQKTDGTQNVKTPAPPVNTEDTSTPQGTGQTQAPSRQTSINNGGGSLSEGLGDAQRSTM